MKIYVTKIQKFTIFAKIFVMLKIGVLGAGHLGKIHINCIKQIDKYELVGFYDQDENTASMSSSMFL